MKYHSIPEVFNAFKSLSVLVVGDIMLDAYTYGTTVGNSPEAPVPLVKVSNEELRLGGSANVALNIRALGAKCALVGAVGADWAGDMVIDLLAGEGINHQGVITLADRKTTIKKRIISDAHQILRIDHEDDHLLDDQDRKKILQQVMQGTRPDLIILQDYDKGCFEPKIISEIVSWAKGQNILIAVDPKFRNFHAYTSVDLFKPNYREFLEGIKGIYVDGLNAQMATLVDDLKIKNLLLTVGKDGMHYCSGHQVAHLKAHFRSIKDVSGAGDTVIAVSAACMALDLPLIFAAELANLAGGMVCESVGVVPVDSNRLLTEAVENDMLLSSIHAL